MKKTIDDLTLENKVVLLRTDFNVPMNKGIIMSNKRIVESLPTIQKIISSNAKLVIFSHLGRVKEEKDLIEKDLFPVAVELSRLLKQSVLFVRETKGENLEAAIQKLKNGEVLLVQNTRFEDLNNKAETKNDLELGKYWASLGDIFINDAFGAAHRANASTVGIAQFIKESAMGYLMQKEVAMLSKLTNNPQRPYMAIVGGNKLGDKIPVLNKLINQVDRLFIVGGMAYTFQIAKGRKVANSIVDMENLEFAKEFLNTHGEAKVFLPIDYKVSKEFANTEPLINYVDIQDGYNGMDIGPKTIEKFARAMKKAKTIVWNGPAGVVEFENYKQGTLGLANAIAELNDVYSVVGGGDSAAIIEKENLTHLFSHVSTGGGATLEFIKDGTLVAIEAIKNK